MYSKTLLTLIALLLTYLAVQPAIRPAPVRAQSDNPYLYVEPGVVSLRKPDGSSVSDGKMVIDLRTGDIWGFPSYTAGAPYPVDVTSQKPAVSKPVYLGKYDFAAMKAPQ